MNDDRRVSFSLDGVVSFFHDLLTGVLSVFKPTTAFISQIAGESWLGFLIIFAIFFSIFIARIGARTRNPAAFASAMMSLTRYGLLLSGGYLALAIVNVAIIGPLAALIYMTANSLTGSEHGLANLARVAAQTPGGMGKFWSDLLAFLFGNRAFMPLGFRSVLLVMCAFVCIRMVCKGMLPKEEARA